MKRHIPKIIAVLLLGGFILLAFLSSYTFPNDDDALGNSSGNLLNGGLFCEDDGIIYFSNPNDDGALYSMDLNCENFQKVHNDKVAYINAAGQYVIYVRENYEREAGKGDFFNLNSTGIYRLSKLNGNIKSLYSDPAGVTSLRGNYIYYQHYNAEDGLEFYKVKLDGSDETHLSRDAIIPAAYSGSKLYYCGVSDDHNIYTMNLANNTSNKLYEGNCYNVMIAGNYIYYLSLSNNYAIVRMNLDGSEPEIIVDERTAFMNVTPDGNYLYYQVDGGNNNRLCRMNLKTLRSETVREGNYNSIHTTTNYVFFKEFESGRFYKISMKNHSVESFNPPVLED